MVVAQCLPRRGHREHVAAGLSGCPRFIRESRTEVELWLGRRAELTRGYPSFPPLCQEEAEAGRCPPEPRKTKSLPRAQVVPGFPALGILHPGLSLWEPVVRWGRGAGLQEGLRGYESGVFRCGIWC